MRTEQEVLSDLSTLCASGGYVHAIAHLCLRDNVIVCSMDGVVPDDLARMSSIDRLSRTEISTLIGLMVKSPINYELPDEVRLKEYVRQTDSLMKELHKVMSAEVFLKGDWRKVVAEGMKVFSRGAALREPIFYGGDSAYNFQYRELASRKYAADAVWLQANKGFTIDEACVVLRAISDLQIAKLNAGLHVEGYLSFGRPTVLEALTFTTGEVAGMVNVDVRKVELVLEAFTFPTKSRNEGFNALNDFNTATAQPILVVEEHKFLLLHGYGLTEALYESPFYWMNDDKAYHGTAANNRGSFTEDFARDRLELVFGKGRVHTNVEVYAVKGEPLGEIDVLVIFGNRAIVVQAKSKRLTIEARKGNDLIIKDDFKKSVQESYDQGSFCASMLTDPRYHLARRGGEELKVTRSFKEIYILCVVADDYPALSFQARQFLEHKETDVIKEPFILDVFALDAISEMLQSPLRFLSYLHRRALFGDRVMAAQELTVLAYHLKKNLWLDDKIDLMSLDDGIGADLDIAMSVRREGIAGKATPEGILTRFADTSLARVIDDIEDRENPGTIELGFLLLAVSGDTVSETSAAIDGLAAQTRRDGKKHDLTLGFREEGLTVHCSDEPIEEALAALRDHCERRKYAHKVNLWFGLCVRSKDARLRGGITLQTPWKYDASMARATKDMPAGVSSMRAVLRAQRKQTKVGRNEPCPCGSGLKYKKCCGSGV